MSLCLLDYKLNNWMIFFYKFMYNLIMIKTWAFHVLKDEFFVVFIIDIVVVCLDIFDIQLFGLLNK